MSEKQQEPSISDLFDYQQKMYRELKGTITGESELHRDLLWAGIIFLGILVLALHARS